MTNPRDVKYANESIAAWQNALKERAMLATNNIAFACLRGVLHELRAGMSLENIARFGNHLPAVQRGVFYQEVPDLVDFEAALASRLLPHVHMQEGIAADMLWVLKTQSEPVDAAELEAALPMALAEVWQRL